MTLRVERVVVKALTALQREAAAASGAVGNAVDFVGQAYGEGNELIALFGVMTLNKRISTLVGTHGCPTFFEHSKALMLGEREAELASRLDKLAGFMSSLDACSSPPTPARQLKERASLPAMRGCPSRGSEG